MYNLKSNSTRLMDMARAAPGREADSCADYLEAEMPAEKTKSTLPAGHRLALLTSVSLWAAKAPTEILLGKHTKGLTKPEKNRHSQSGMSTVTHL